MAYAGGRYGPTAISSDSYAGGGGGGGSGGGGSQPQQQAQPSYFSDFKKGEVMELMGQLRATSSPAEKAAGKQREVVKKVIAYMTLGIDVSRLFSEMIMATNTTDMVQKKLVYLYLTNYAQEYPDLSILAINTLLKDCNDDNPMVRGLALRALSTLRLPNLLEYLVRPIKSGLRDPAAYVRKTAVMGCAKLFKIAKNEVTDPTIINSLYEMLRDRDPQVIVNVIFTLNEILADEGGIAINKNIVIHLLNRLKEFNEWGQTLILETVSKYEPSDEEIVDIMNLLDEKLQHANSAVVFATAKIFLKFTATKPQLYLPVLMRLKAPLITLMASGCPELTYATLHHIYLLAYRSPGLFSNEFKIFFCKFDDPTYVKYLKIDVLIEIASGANTNHIITELAEYVRDVDRDLGRRSVKAIGAIAAKWPSVARPALDTLLSFIDGAVSYVGPVTVIVMKDILRRYPEHAADVISVIKKCLSSIDEPEAKAAMVWMLGEYGDQIDEAPYILEDIIEHYEEEKPAVKSQLLTSMLKMFFRSPAECQPGLGVLFKKALNDYSHIDVHDRALLYYRLVTADINEAERVIMTAKEPISQFPEEDTYAIKDRVFEEFNSLSVIYGQPADIFMKHYEPTDLTTVVYEEPTAEEEEEEEEEEEQVSLQLVPNAKVDAETYKHLWTTLPSNGAVEATFPRVIDNVKELEAKLAQKSIFLIAGGLAGTQLKSYLIAQNANGPRFLVELIIDVIAKTVRCQFKGEQPAYMSAFISYFQNALVSCLQQ